MEKLPKDKKIILFDGVCNLCDATVQKVIKADKKDINLDFFMPLNFNRRVICDEVKLNQVIYNLISNSIKFSNKIYGFTFVIFF